MVLETKRIDQVKIAYSYFHAFGIEISMINRINWLILKNMLSPEM